VSSILYTNVLSLTTIKIIRKEPNQPKRAALRNSARRRRQNRNPSLCRTYIEANKQVSEMSPKTEARA
jgi:hypothetical protein